MNADDPNPTSGADPNAADAERRQLLPAGIDGPALRSLRVQMGIPLSLIARTSGLSLGYMDKVECGDPYRPVTPRVLAAYEEAIGLLTDTGAIKVESVFEPAPPPDLSKRKANIRDGRWVAWLLLDMCEPGASQADKLPPRRTLRWSTRSAQQQELDHYWSQPGQAGVVPAVETALYRITLRRWWGAPLTLWRTAVTVQVWVDQVVTLRRDRAFADEHAARQDFAAHGAGLRQTLAGESRPRYQLRRSEAPGT